MGYESKLIVVQTSDLRCNSDPEGFKWAERIAEFNLCKMAYSGAFSKALQKMRDTKYFYYADDGNTPVIEDKYEERLKEINIKPLIKILEKENKEYRRIQPAINLLKSFDNDSWSNTTVLIYGY